MSSPFCPLSFLPHDNAMQAHLQSLSVVSAAPTLSKYALCLRHLLWPPRSVWCLAFDVVCLRFAAKICKNGLLLCASMQLRWRKEAWEKSGLPRYDEKTGHQMRRHAILRCAAGTKTHHVCFFHICGMSKYQTGQSENQNFLVDTWLSERVGGTALAHRPHIRNDQNGWMGAWHPSIFPSKRPFQWRAWRRNVARVVTVAVNCFPTL